MGAGTRGQRKDAIHESGRDDQSSGLGNKTLGARGDSETPKKLGFTRRRGSSRNSTKKEDPRGYSDRWRDREITAIAPRESIRLPSWTAALMDTS